MVQNEHFLTFVPPPQKHSARSAFVERRSAEGLLLIHLCQGMTFPVLFTSR